MKKVIILVQNGQTGLRKVGTEAIVLKSQAEHWIKNKWAKEVKTIKKKK